MNVTSIIKRGAFLACLLGISAASAFANSTPIEFDDDNGYAESFASWNEGLVVGQTDNIVGWVASADDASTITNLGGVAGNALNLNTEGQTLSVNFDDPTFDCEDELFVDAMVKFVVSEDDPANIEEEVKTALFLNSNSNLVIYSGVFDAAKDKVVGTNTIITDVQLDPENFYRLTIEMVADTNGQNVYKYYIDGVPVVGPAGVAFDDAWFEGGKDDNNFDITAEAKGGLWFIHAYNSGAHLSSIAFQGTGMIDDLAVSREMPIAETWALTLAATENGSFTVDSEAKVAGTYDFDVALDVNVAAVPATGYYLTSFTTNDVPVSGASVTFSKMAKDAAVTVAATFAKQAAKIGDQGYDTLAAALAVAQADDTIVLADNVEVDSWILINKEVTLDLAGNTISPSDNWDESCDAIIAINRGGKLTIVDSSDPSAGCIDSETVMVGVKMTATKALDYIDPATYGDGNKAEFILNNGTIKGFNYGISGNGNAGRGNTAVTINGGKVIATGNGDTEGCVGIYNPQLGTLTINGGYIEGDEGVVVKAGSVTCTVNAGTIVGVGANNEYVGGNNGADPTGAGFAIDNAGYPGGTPSASIVGGTFVSSNGVAVASYNRASTTAIEGFVSGGTFNTEVPAALCAIGFKPKDNGDGTYGVEKAVYTLTYVTEQGTAPAAVEYTVDTANFALAAAPEATGYTFLGWVIGTTTNAAGATFVVADNLADTTATAAWEQASDPYPNSVKAGDIVIKAVADGGSALSFGAPVVGASTVTIPFTADIVGEGTVSSGLFLQVKYDLTSDEVDTVAGTFTFGDNNTVEIALPTGKAMLFAVGITDEE